MKILYSPAPLFERSAMAASSCRNRAERRSHGNHANPPELIDNNPLGKIPTLITDDGWQSTTAADHAFHRSRNRGQALSEESREAYPDRDLRALCDGIWRQPARDSSTRKRSIRLKRCTSPGSTGHGKRWNGPRLPRSKPAQDRRKLNARSFRTRRHAALHRTALRRRMAEGPAPSSETGLPNSRSPLPGFIEVQGLSIRSLLLLAIAPHPALRPPSPRKRGEGDSWRTPQDAAQTKKAGG